MASRGESFSGMFLMEMSKSVANQQENNPLAINLDVMLSMLTADRLYRVRRIAAVQLAKSGNGDAFAGFDGTSTIITERNRKCFEVMDRELRKEEGRHFLSAPGISPTWKSGWWRITDSHENPKTG